MKHRLMLALLASFFPAVFLAQAKPDVKPDQLVRLWFDRWNALDGSEQNTNQLLELYRPDAFHQVGPNARQTGSVSYEGRKAIRKMIDDFVKANKDISFKIQAASANEKGSDLFFVTDGPWGGPSVAVQYVAVYTGRTDNHRWMYPGAAFFQIQDGKIRGVRLIADRDETLEAPPVK
jgi:SnoaL-like domain